MAPSEDPVASAEPKRSGLQILLLGVLVLASVAIALWTGLYLTGGLHDPEDWVVSGVSLGMTPEAARAAFKDAASGEWVTKKGCDGLAYEWNRRGQDTASPARAKTKSPSVVWVRMEFHEGLLVAYRVKLDHPTRKHVVEVMSAAVREERATREGETITLLSRECPSHQAEAEQLALHPS